MCECSWVFWSVCISENIHTPGCSVGAFTQHCMRIGVGLSRCAHTHVGYTQMCARTNRNVRNVCICRQGITLTSPFIPTDGWKKWDSGHFWDSIQSLRD